MEENLMKVEQELRDVKNELHMLVKLHTMNRPLIEGRYPYKYQNYIKKCHLYQDLWENVTKLQKKYDQGESK